MGKEAICMKNKKILITGASGYLGSNLVRLLIANDYKVVLLIREVSSLAKINDCLAQIEAIYKIEEDGINRAFSEHHIECVIHCATNYGRNQNEASQIVQANLILPLTILETGKKSGLKYFVNTDTLLDKNVSNYSLSKRQFNEWLHATSGDLVAINVGLEHFYGPADDNSKFVSWLLDSMIRNESSISLTTGEQRRDFIYIDDVLSAFLVILEWGMNQKNGYFPFEVGTGVNTPIKDLVLMLAKLTNYDVAKLKFGAIPARVNEVMESRVNLTNLKGLNWNPKVTLEDGLKKYIAEEKRIRGIQ